eukprot:scaffold9615_cov111-Skeletonema_marinoi.AAC.4
MKLAHSLQTYGKKWDANNLLATCTYVCLFSAKQCSNGRIQCVSHLALGSVPNNFQLPCKSNRDKRIGEGHFHRNNKSKGTGTGTGTGTSLSRDNEYRIVSSSAAAAAPSQPTPS